MITNIRLKGIAKQIGKAFCQDDVICQEGVANRLIISFNNNSFENVFLPRLINEKFYSVKLVNYKLTNTRREYTFEYTDLITGVKQSRLMTAGLQWSSQQFLEGIPSNLLASGFELVSGNPNYSSSNFSDVRIYASSLYGSYGISYTVDPQAGGSGSAGTTGTGGTAVGQGHIIINPPKKKTTVLPTQTEPVKAGFFDGLDFDSLVLPVGVAVISALLIKRFAK